MKQNKRDRILLSILQGSSGQDSKGETLCREAVVGAVVNRESEEVRECMVFSFFGTCAQ